MRVADSKAEPFDFLVRRDDLHRCELRPAPPIDSVALEPGQVLLAVDAFALTANNVTYAVFGDAMRYWNFFPAPDGFGRVPVWGFATVTRSEHPGVKTGERVFGYLPMSTYFVVQADDVTRGSFFDRSPHRAENDAFYNQYQKIAADPGYDAKREAEQMLLRPLFFTGFLIDDFMADNSFFGARTVMVSSASSKTSIALAFQLFQRGREHAEVLGLTSKRNVEFVRGLGIHHRVLAYDEIETIAKTTPVVFVDMAGDADVTSRVHHHFQDALKYSCQVGATHWDHVSMGLELPGPQPVLFWAPGQLAKRMSDWGPAGFQARAAEAWARFMPHVDKWMRVERRGGGEEIQRTFLETLDGRADPRKGYVLSPAAS
jgi:hypothetical protein